MTSRYYALMSKRGNGEGSLTYDKRRKRWRARITVHTPEGSKRKSLPYTKTKDESRTLMIEALSRSGQRAAALGNLAGRVTVAEYLGDWLRNTARLNVSGDVYRLYEHEVSDYISPVVGSAKLSELKSLHVRVVKQELLDRGLAEATVAHAMGTLSTALNQAVQDELISKNPTKSVKRPKKRGDSMRIFSEEQIGVLLAGVAGTRYEALYEVAVKLGLRQGELCALFWEDVDFSEARHTMIVRRSVQTRRAGAEWSATKSGAEREILLPPNVEACLRRHRTMQNEKRLKAKRWEDPRLVFANTRGSVTRRSEVYSTFIRHLEEFGLPRIRFHDLRHTAITMMLRYGVDVRTAADIAGHADPAITLSRYSHVLPSMQARARDIIENYGF